MDLGVAKSYLGVIKAEEIRRRNLLADEPSESDYDRWLFTDAPFISELCLVFLVALRHHIERRLFHFAACALDGGRPIKRADYEKRAADLKGLPDGKRWGEIGKRLNVTKCMDYKIVEALRLLANAYKHEPTKQPGVVRIPGQGERDSGVIAKSVPG